MGFRKFRIYFKKGLDKYIRRSIRDKYNARLRIDQYNGPARMFLAFVYGLNVLTHLFKFFILKRIYLVQMDFVITTSCVLKCKHCNTYIPTIEKEFQRNMSFDEFKTYLDNLLVYVSSVINVSIVGGEPLLNKDAAKIFHYALECEKIKKVAIITTGILDIPQEIIELSKQFSHKAIIVISDYTSNEALRPRLKTQAIIENLKDNNIVYQVWGGSGGWYAVSPVKKFNRSKEDNKKVYLSCILSCAAVNAYGFLSICQRAGTFLLRQLLPPSSGNQTEYIDLSKPASRKDLIDFYSNDDFRACDFCNFTNEFKVRIPPAEQID